MLILVGDFDPDDALIKMKKYFGEIPSQPTPASAAADLLEEPHYGERREIIYDPLARLPEIDIAYHIPRGQYAGQLRGGAARASFWAGRKFAFSTNTS